MPSTSWSQTSDMTYPKDINNAQFRNLHFTHCKAGCRGLVLLEYLEEIQKKIRLRVKSGIRFDHSGPKFRFAQWGKQRISPTEFDSLLQLAFEPILFKDSAFLILNVGFQIVGREGLLLFEYNNVFDEQLHMKNTMKLENTSETYLKFESDWDSVFCGEYRGVLSMINGHASDTIVSNAMEALIYISDNQPVEIAGLPEEAFGLIMRTFVDADTFIEIGFDYVKMPGFKPLEAQNEEVLPKVCRPQN